MNQTSYSPDKFGTYLSHPGSQGCDIDLSSANVLEILLAYRAFRQTLNASYSTIKLYCNLLKAALVWASRHIGNPLQKPDVAVKPIEVLSIVGHTTRLAVGSKLVKLAQVPFRRKNELAAVLRAGI